MYYDEYCYWAQVAVLLMYLDIGLLGQVIYKLYIGYVLRVELPIQRRLCSIFVRDVGSPGIHERFCGLTGSQRTPGIWGVTTSSNFTWKLSVQNKFSDCATQSRV